MNGFILRQAENTVLKSGQGHQYRFSEVSSVHLTTNKWPSVVNALT